MWGRKSSELPEPPPKHDHFFVEQERFYAEPVVAKLIEVNWDTSHFSINERVLLGLTTILYRCDCGHVWPKEIIGKALA